jgi:Tol biopolymer transport system component
VFAKGAAAVAILAALTAVVLPAAAKTPGANGRIVFGKFVPGRNGGDTPLFTANPDGSAQRLLLSASSCCAAWSPDGRRIAVSHLSPDGRITTALVNPDGSDLQVMPLPDSTLNLECNAWSPDGSRMACSGWDDKNKNRPRGLFTIRVSDWRDLEQLTTNPNGDQGLNDGDSADYSPNGKQIVFIRENPGDHQDGLFVVSADGGGLKEIPLRLPVTPAAASWSPGGKWILFNVLGAMEVVRPDGSGEHEIALKPHCVSRSGLAVLAGIRVYRLRCHNGRFTKNPDILYWEPYGPSWSPDGKKMVLSLAIQTSATEGTRGVYTANADGTGLEPLGKPLVVNWRSLDFPASTDWGRASRRGPGRRARVV